MSTDAPPSPWLAFLPELYRETLRERGASLTLTILAHLLLAWLLLHLAPKLIEQDKVQILLSPLSGDEGIAVKNFAKTHPELTFINAASGAQETTYVDPAPNFFRYNMDGAQWQVGLGKYAYEEKKYRKIATVGEDYSFIYTQVFGLVLEFCGLGGQVTNRQWVPLGTKDFASVIAALPDDVDAIYLGLGGADAVNFLNQYQQAGGKAHLMGGSIMIDQTILSSKGSAKNALVGTIAASGQADTWEDPGWQKFVKAYQDAFPPAKRFPSPFPADTPPERVRDGHRHRLVRRRADVQAIRPGRAQRLGQLRAKLGGLAGVVLDFLRALPVHAVEATKFVLRVPKPGCIGLAVVLEPGDQAPDLGRGAAGAGRGDEVLRQRRARIQLGRGLLRKLDGNIGAAVRGIEGGHHAGPDLRRSLGAAGFVISSALASSSGPHAGPHDRLADGHPAVLEGRLLGQRRGRAGRTQQDGQGQQLRRQGEVSTALKQTGGVKAHLQRPSVK